MMRDLSTVEWKTLRLLVREEAATGLNIRLMFMNRVTKDGSFLTTMVEEGLIELTDKSKPNSHPFEPTYRLTQVGKYAAEHGEIEFDLDKRVASLPFVEILRLEKLLSVARKAGRINQIVDLEARLKYAKGGAA